MVVIACCSRAKSARPAILRRRGEAQKTALMQVREIVVGKVAAAIKLCRLFGHQLTNEVLQWC